MTAIFLDTSGLLAYLFEDEPQHDHAVQFFELDIPKMTSQLVLLVLTALAQARKYPRPSVIRSLDELLIHPLIQTLWTSRSDFESGLQLLKQRLDKTYSLCDAISFQIMRTHRITHALTTDRHFEQEGFQRLLVT